MQWSCGVSVVPHIRNLIHIFEQQQGPNPTLQQPLLHAFNLLLATVALDCCRGEAIYILGMYKAWEVTK